MQVLVPELSLCWGRAPASKQVARTMREAAPLLLLTWQLPLLRHASVLPGCPTVRHLLTAGLRRSAAGR